MDDLTDYAEDCIDAVLGGPAIAAAFADDIGYTADEVYTLALAAACLGFNPKLGAYATGHDLLYDVEQAVADRATATSLIEGLTRAGVTGDPFGARWTQP